jgi:Flp pilus assembly protein TadB
VYVVVGQAPSPQKRRETKKERLRRKKESQRDRRRERRPKKHDGKGVKEPNDGDGEETGIVGALAIAMVACLAYAIASVIIGGICMCMCMPSAIVVPIEVLDMPVAVTVAAATAVTGMPVAVAAATAVPDMPVAATVAAATVPVADVVDLVSEDDEPPHWTADAFRDGQTRFLAPAAADLVSEDDEPHWTVDAFREGQARFLTPAAAPGHTRPPSPSPPKRRRFWSGSFGARITVTNSGRPPRNCKAIKLAPRRNATAVSSASKSYSSESRTTKMPERFKSHWSYKAFCRGRETSGRSEQHSSDVITKAEWKRRAISAERKLKRYEESATKHKSPSKSGERIRVNMLVIALFIFCCFMLFVPDLESDDEPTTTKPFVADSESDDEPTKPFRRRTFEHAPRKVLATWRPRPKDSRSDE